MAQNGGDKMNAKMGRPIIGAPKTKEIKARIDESTYNRLLEYCKKNNLSKTEVVRLGVKKVLSEK